MKVFGYIFLAISYAALVAGTYMATHDYNGSGTTSKGQISINAYIVLLIAAFCAGFGTGLIEK